MYSSRLVLYLFIDLLRLFTENFNALVYKNGQAGITKCSVTITFDNRDKKNRPLNYDSFDEIIVRRQVFRSFADLYSKIYSMLLMGALLIL